MPPETTELHPAMIAAAKFEPRIKAHANSMDFRLQLSRSLNDYAISHHLDAMKKMCGSIRGLRPLFIEAQLTYCKNAKVPMFLPNDGFCFSCSQDVIPHLTNRMGHTHITSCPLCNRSWCD